MKGRLKMNIQEIYNEIAVTSVKNTVLTGIGSDINEDELKKNGIVIDDSKKVLKSAALKAETPPPDIPVIQLEEGTYIEDNFEINFPVKIVGADYVDVNGNHISKTIIKTSVNSDTIMYIHDCQNVEISNLTLDKDGKAKVAAAFIGANDFNGSSVKNCRVTGAAGPGTGGSNLYCSLLALNGCTNISFENNVVEGTMEGVYGGGIGFINANGITIKNNVIDGNWITGNGIEGIIYGPSEISGNKITNCGFAGVYENQASLDVHDNTLTQNYDGAIIGAWTTSMRKNKIFGNTHYELDPTATFDAKENYWASNNPTTLKFSEIPLLAPWYTDENMTTLSTPASSITVSSEGGTTSVHANGKLQMYASELPTNVTVPGILWSIKEPSIGSSINDNGLLSAGSTQGTITIIAKAKDYSGVSGSIQINILP